MSTQTFTVEPIRPGYESRLSVGYQAAYITALGVDGNNSYRAQFRASKGGTVLYEATSAAGSIVFDGSGTDPLFNITITAEASAKMCDEVVFDITVDDTTVLDGYWCWPVEQSVTQPPAV